MAPIKTDLYENGSKKKWSKDKLEQMHLLYTNQRQLCYQCAFQVLPTSMKIRSMFDQIQRFRCPVKMKELVTNQYFRINSGDTKILQLSESGKRTLPTMLWIM